MIDDMLHGKEVHQLDSSSIQSCIRHIDQLITAGVPMEKELKLQAIKLRLIQRFREVIKEEFKGRLNKGGE